MIEKGEFIERCDKPMIIKEADSQNLQIPTAGFGNTNDGNTSRRFFSDPQTSSCITGVNIALIKNFSIILETLSSGCKIDIKKFEKFAELTAELSIEIYGWYPMTPTMQKILRHGATIIDQAILRIGQLSEEAAEARNKHFRDYRQNFSRKFSREICNRDIINRLLLNSDPLLSSVRKRLKNKRNAISSEALEFLQPETLNELQQYEEEASSKNESD